MKKEKQFILHNTVIHVALVVVWIVESFCLNKKDCPSFVFESCCCLCIVFKLHSRRGGPIRSDVSKILNRRAQDPSQDPTEIAWEFYFEKLLRAKSKMII